MTEVELHCKRCGKADCHQYYDGYCSSYCRDLHEEEQRVDDLVSEVERLRAENGSLRKALSDTEEELDDLYRSNPFYKGKPDA